MPKPKAGIVAPVLSFAVVTETMVRLCSCEENWEILDDADDNLAVRESMMEEKKAKERQLKI